jgi:hypothetical protein
MIYDLISFPLTTGKGWSPTRHSLTSPERFVQAGALATARMGEEFPSLACLAETA